MQISTRLHYSDTGVVFMCAFLFHSTSLFSPVIPAAANERS